jgi:hypothetical protein
VNRCPLSLFDLLKVLKVNGISMKYFPNPEYSGVKFFGGYPI